MKNIIIGTGSDLGNHIDGERLGPKQLINDIKPFYQDEIKEIYQDEEIIKSKNLSDHRKNQDEIEKLNEKIYNLIKQTKKDDSIRITIGGDQTISIASALANIDDEQDDYGLIWISASPSFHTLKTTTSGNLSGTVLSTLIGKEIELAPFHKYHRYNEARCAIIGMRDIDDTEGYNLKYTTIKTYTTIDIKDRGIKEIVKEAFSIAAYKTKKVHVVYSLDIIDPSIAPGVSIPIYDGINEEEALTLNEEILRYIKYMSSYDLVGFNPLRDVDRKTEQIALNLITQVIKSTKELQKL